MKNREIERKYLINKSNIPNLDKMSYMDITQGYIHDIGNHLIFRLRQIIYMDNKKNMLGEEYTQTIKGTEGVDRAKYESQIWRSTFDKFWKLCEYKSVHKYRYIIPRKDEDKKIIHLDVYKNELNGLYTVDVEFETLEDSEDYTPEDWFGIEITNDQRYANVNLAYTNKIPS